MKVAWMIALALVACQAGPDPISVGTDTCDRCRMLISDVRFAGEYVSPGKVAKFDSLDELKAAAPHGATLYAADFTSGHLVPLPESTLVSDPKAPIPMGGTTLAFASKEEAERFVERHASDGCRLLSPASWLQAK